MSIIQDLLALFEDKSDHLVKALGPKLLAAAKKEKKKFETAEDVVKELSKADPKHKNIVWIARMYIAGHFRMEDVSRMKQELENFETVKRHLDNKDLNSYKNLEELYAAIDAAKPGVDEKAKIELTGKEKDATFLFRTKNYIALVPKTKESACKYGAGTRWCTAAANRNRFDYYNRSGDLIIIIAKIGDKWRKFQIHFSTDSMMDENDTRIKREDLVALSKHPEHAQLIRLLVKKHYGAGDE